MPVGDRASVAMNPANTMLSMAMLMIEGIHRKIFLCLLALVMLPGFARAATRKNDPYQLEIKDFETGKILLSFPLAKDETFTIRYIHSVDHTPVFEVFEIDDQGRLAIQATYFKMFGAGMGYWPGRGKVDYDGTWTWIRDLHEPLGSFILRVGSKGVDHTILYRHLAINLSDTWAGKRVVVTVVRVD